MKLKSTLILTGLLFAQSSLASLPKAVIFDIDDTLVDTNYRTHEIFREIGSSLGISEFVQLSFENTHFYCSQTIKNANVSQQTLKSLSLTEKELEKKICNDEWRKRFFANANYIPYDHVLSGAPLFVSKLLKSLGADIVYLTGRDQDSTEAQTIKQLQYFGFPDPTQPGATLITQPKNFVAKNGSTSDVEFKRQVLHELQKKYLIVAVFDDSKSNSNMFRDELDASVPVIRPNRNVADLNGLQAGIEQITDYYIDVEVIPGTLTHSPNQKRLDDIIQRAKSVTKN